MSINKADWFNDGLMYSQEANPRVFQTVIEDTVKEDIKRRTSLAIQ